MTTKQAAEIKRNFRDAAKIAFSHAERLARSGGIDPNAEHFCKVITHCALKEVAAQFRPLTSDGKVDAKNLEHF